MILATCQCHILSYTPSIWVSHSCTKSSLWKPSVKAPRCYIRLWRVNLGIFMLAPNIVTRCWRKKSTNLWPSGVAPWKPDCRTGFLSQFSFPLFGFHHISEAWVAIWFKWEKSGLFRNQLWQFSAQNCSWVLGSSASNCTGKTISWKKDSKYFLFAFPWRIERCTMSLLIFHCEATLVSRRLNRNPLRSTWQLI